MGQVRFELRQSADAVISFSVDHKARGRGVAGALLRAGLRAAARELPLRRFVAVVRPENAASIRLFEACGFERTLEPIIEGVRVLQFQRPPTPTLAIVAGLDSARSAGPARQRRVVVLDGAWVGRRSTPATARSLRDVALEVLATEDLFERTSQFLDGWQERSGVIDALTVDGSSLWLHERLNAWRWLYERLVWLALLDRLLAAGGILALEVPEREEAALLDAAALVAARDGIEGWAVGSDGGDAQLEAFVRAAASLQPQDPMPPPRPPRRPRLTTRLLRRLGLVPTDPAVTERARRREALARLMREARRGKGWPLLLLTDTRIHQRVEMPGGPRLVDPFLEPLVRVLRGTPLRPVWLELDRRPDGAHLGGREGATPAATPVTLPADVVDLRYGLPEDQVESVEQAARVLERLATVSAPLQAFGVDLGPRLSAEQLAVQRRKLAPTLRRIARARRLLRELRPAGLLLVNEYGRVDWVAAARAEGIAVAAFQHGVIHRWHVGYVHPSRPPSLPLPDRTYLYGDWERRLLLRDSVFREEELRVVGSPRLDLVTEPAGAWESSVRDRERERVRAELGVAASDRMVVISTTRSELFRRFHLLPALATLLDGSLPRVHLVVKLHPAEHDEGPYRALVDGLARAGGHEPPPTSVVREIDLHRLLAAADAHLGLYSTVVTDAVAAGTGNLIATTHATRDLLGYVEAGVALPVASRAELLGGLDSLAAGAISRGARQAFIEDHFLPGDASARIRDDLLAWLAPTSPASRRGDT